MSQIATLLPVVPRYLRLLRSQYWSPAVMEAHRCAQLAQIMRAASQIPFYRQRLDGLEQRPSNTFATSDLARMPILKRAEVSALDQSVREIIGKNAVFFSDKSSGSTGMPMEFLFDATHQAGRYAARIRYLRANGWNPARRNVWIVAMTSSEDESQDAQLLRSRLRLRSTRSPIFAPFAEQVDGLLKLNPDFFYTMPSNLEGLLGVFERRKTRLTSLRRIFSGGEVLDDSIRERTLEVLGVPISDNYGSTEGFAAWQCPNGTYHINAEHMLVEIVDEQNRPVAPGQMGRVLITTLENRLMPLIRYEIGDYAIASNEKCGCGRRLPVMGKILGRGMNLFRLPGDRLLSPWPLVGPLKSRPQIRQFQIEQETFEHYLVRYSGDAELDAESKEEIRKSFSKTLGLEVAVSFARMDSIPRTAGGKFMTAFSRLAR